MHDDDGIGQINIHVGYLLVFAMHFVAPRYHLNWCLLFEKLPNAMRYLTMLDMPSPWDTGVGGLVSIGCSLGVGNIGGGHHWLIHEYNLMNCKIYKTTLTLDMFASP